jgi:hypothetical protein
VVSEVNQDLSSPAAGCAAETYGGFGAHENIEPTKHEPMPKFLNAVSIMIAGAILCAARAAAVTALPEQHQVPQGETVKGQLCLADELQCTPTTGLRFVVPEASSDRRYVWMTEDYEAVFLGVVPASSSLIDVRAGQDEMRVVSLAVRGDAQRSWPADVAVTIQESRDKEWKWTIPASASETRTKLHLPPGDFVLLLTAPRHYRHGRRLPAGPQTDLGVIQLKPLPGIRGRIVQTKDAAVVPVWGASIVFGDGKVGGVSDEQGRFRVELAEPVTMEFTVVSPGLGSRTLKVDRIERENDLGEIRLDAGVTLTLEIEREEDLLNESLRVQLMRHDDTLHHLHVARAELAPDEEELSFADLSPGKYYVQLSGERPLERMSVAVEIDREDVTKRIAIAPFRLRGQVLLGEEPVRNAEVELMPPEEEQNVWRAKLALDEEGSFRAVLWQRGRLTAFVHGKDLGGVLHDESPELGTDPSEWTIRFKNRLIHGRIVDSENGVPAKDARLDLKTTGPKANSRSSIRVSPQGEYRILAWRDAIYDLIVSAPDYLPETRTIVLGEVEGSQEIDFALDRGLQAEVQFFWPGGQPILSPNIYEGVARDGRQPERQHRTNSAGVLSMSVPAGGSRLIYVLPYEGSFTPVRVSAKRSADDPPVRVEVPLPSGTLRLKLKVPEERVGEVFVVMRYNGEWIPHVITARLRQSHGNGFIEFPGLPDGAYDVWVLQSLSGSVPSSIPSAPPARGGVGAGTSEVEVDVIEVP